MTGADRQQALERSRRALAEFVVEGMATALPFHRAVVDDPAFAEEPFRVHTRWIETEFVNLIPPYEGAVGASTPEEQREKVTVEVGGRRLEVVLPAGLGSAPAAGSPAPRRRGRSRTAAASGGGDVLTSPMQGTIVKVGVDEGALVEAGDLIVVLEAMKMEQPINAHKAGLVTGLTAVVGDPVSSGAAICEIRDAH